MPDAEKILELMEDHDLDRQTAEEVADFMDETGLDDEEEAIEIYENL